MNDPGDVIITDVSDTIFLKTDEATTDKIWTKVSDPLRLLTLWIEIKPPTLCPTQWEPVRWKWICRRLSPSI
ncbi:MAG: hypothetical protein OMM_11348 [Candidatus Magnetoglobus multicellularis str. Araruama]|uniref:Uncharacterized protein n=1 Tax=Candidatus Magnetoglobus multicellularis str. Araruama TaxID=890399 RepID=A0A1V1NYG4_9BACT|nr:MAG: hypothetical protein OMM_11348 [Candidatus Magnetoglobus multicellularis str. Araruama]